MKMRMIVTAGVAVAAIATSAFGADVEVVRAFDGNRGPGWKAGADLAGAVGPKHVAALTEGGYMVQEKATGKVVSQMTAREFWNKVEAGKDADKGTGFDPQKECNDPRI